MKRLSILLFLVLLGTGMCFAQEAEAAIPDTENSAIPEEEITVPGVTRIIGIVGSSMTLLAAYDTFRSYMIHFRSFMGR